MSDEFRSTMRWMLKTDWACGGASIPASSVLEAPANIVTGALDGEIRWQGWTVRPPLPLDAIALDTDSATQMQVWYPAYLHHQLQCAPGVRADLKARQAAEANWKATRQRISLEIVSDDLKARLKEGG
jgi:hypothetical protein